MEQAVKSGNVDEVLSLANEKENLVNGIIACLCEKNADILEMLLKQADNVPFSVLNWWFLEYKQFNSPSFLLENPRFYELLVVALFKSFYQASSAEKWLEKVLELLEAPTAAKVELSFIATLLKHAIDCSETRFHMRISRADIPKDLPRTELSEMDLLRRKRQELLQRRDSLIRDLEKLSAERSDIERQIADLDAKMHI